MARRAEFGFIFNSGLLLSPAAFTCDCRYRCGSDLRFASAAAVGAAQTCVSTAAAARIRAAWRGIGTAEFRSH